MIVVCFILLNKEVLYMKGLVKSMVLFFLDDCLRFLVNKLIWVELIFYNGCGLEIKRFWFLLLNWFYFGVCCNCYGNVRDLLFFGVIILIVVVLYLIINRGIFF